MNLLLEKAHGWLLAGRRAAIATVIETWGSSPCPRGSQLAVRDDALFVGSVSGGCVEGKVVEAAEVVLADGVRQMLVFGVSNEDAWEVGLACGGTVKIRVELASAELLARVVTARAAHEPLVLLMPLDGPTRIDDGEPDLRVAAAHALVTDDASTVDTPAGAIFVKPVNPPLKLVIIGAVHIAEALAAIAKLLGYDVTLIDPRSGFTRAERWPGIDVKTAWPDEVLASMTLDQRTAVVLLTHDPKIDDPALEAALRSRAFYVGALGSKKTHAARVDRLKERGFDEATTLRIHGPIGLRIGARSAPEVAVSIIGQMTEVLRGSPG